MTENSEVRKEMYGRMVTMPMARGGGGDRVSQASHRHGHRVIRSAHGD